MEHEPKACAAVIGTQIMVILLYFRSHLGHLKSVYIYNCQGLSCVTNFWDEEMKPAGFLFQIENLFYNMVARRKALQNSNDDYSKIVDLICRFSIHHVNVNFSCRKVCSPAYTFYLLLK